MLIWALIDAKLASVDHKIYQRQPGHLQSTSTTQLGIVNSFKLRILAIVWITPRTASVIVKARALPRWCCRKRLPNLQPCALLALKTTFRGILTAFFGRSSAPKTKDASSLDSLLPDLGQHVFPVCLPRWFLCRSGTLATSWEPTYEMTVASSISKFHCVGF